MCTFSLYSCIRNRQEISKFKLTILLLVSLSCLSKIGLSICSFITISIHSKHLDNIFDIWFHPEFYIPFDIILYIKLLVDFASATDIEICTMEYLLCKFFA